MRSRFASLLLLALSALSCGCSNNERAEYAYYGVEWLGNGLPATLEAGRQYRFPVAFRNTGTGYWMPDSDIHVAYSLYDGTGTRILIHASSIWPISSIVRPGEATTEWPNVYAPVEPGEYQLRFDMLQNRVASFEDRGSQPYILKVSVIPARYP